jgi:hypothetical protein
MIWKDSFKDFKENKEKENSCKTLPFLSFERQHLANNNFSFLGSKLEN